jgi:hypothetical protein
MKRIRSIFVTLFLLAAGMTTAQPYDIFLDNYHFMEKIPGSKTSNTMKYDNINGSPYLDREFQEGILFLNDTLAARLPVRFNIYTNEIEYQMDGVVYTPGDRSAIKKAMVGRSVLVWSHIIGHGSYVEQLVAGKGSLFQKRSVQFKPEEPPKPIIGTSTPAEFVRDFDSYYFELSGSIPIEIKSMNGLIEILSDKKDEMQRFIKSEKLRRMSKEHLIRVITYYNTL